MYGRGELLSLREWEGIRGHTARLMPNTNQDDLDASRDLQWQLDISA
jgi:hypothetical protein